MSHETIQSEMQRPGEWGASKPQLPQSPQWCAGQALDQHLLIARAHGRQLYRVPQRLEMHRADVRGMVDAMVQTYGVPVRLTSDAEIRDAAIGLHPDAGLDELSEYRGLLVVEVGLVAHKNRQAAGALHEVVKGRHWGCLPVWVVSYPETPWVKGSHSHSEGADQLLRTRHQYRSVFATTAAPSTPPVPSWPCADWTPSADQRSLLRAEQALQDHLYMRGRGGDPDEEEDFDPWTFDDEGRPTLARRVRRSLPAMPTDAAPRSLLASVYRASAHLLHAMGEGRAEGAARKLRDLEAFATVAGRSLQTLAGEYVSPHHCDSYDALVWRAWLRADPRYREWKRTDDGARKDTEGYRQYDRDYHQQAEVKARRKDNAAVENARKSVRDWTAKHTAAPSERTRAKLLETYARLVRALQPHLPEDEVMAEARRMTEGAR